MSCPLRTICSKSHSEWLDDMIHLLVHNTVNTTQDQVRELVQNNDKQKKNHSIDTATKFQPSLS